MVIGIIFGLLRGLVGMSEYGEGCYQYQCSRCGKVTFLTWSEDPSNDSLCKVVDGLRDDHCDHRYEVVDSDG